MKKLLLTFLFCMIGFSSFGQEFNCETNTYLDCGGGYCNEKTAGSLTVDLDERMILRESSSSGKDFMKINQYWTRDSNNSLYILYEDKNSHGFIVINRLASYTWDFVDTLYTGFGGWVSAGQCKTR